MTFVKTPLESLLSPHELNVIIAKKTTTQKPIKAKNNLQPKRVLLKKNKLKRLKWSTLR